MSEMIERVAVAIFNSDMKWLPIHEHQFQENQQAYLAAARAAIEAMREPTEAMINAGGSWTRDEEKYQRKCYTAMIDAALSDQHPQPDIAEGVPKVNDAH